MVASGKGNNQYSIRKKIYEKIRMMGNKAMCIAFPQKQIHQKKKLTLPKISTTFQAQGIQKSKIKLK